MRFLLPSIWAFLSSVGFAIVFEIKKPKIILISSVIGGLGWLLFLLLEPYVSSVVRYFFATIFITIMAEVAARIWKAPTTVFLLPGIVPLVPGGGLYYCMSFLLDGDYASFAQKGIETAAYAGAIAAGVSIVTSLVRMIFWKRVLIPDRDKRYMKHNF